MTWKVPAWAAGAGAVLSLAVGIAVGNRFGTVLLRALSMAVLAGGVGWLAQYLLLRHLPELGKAAPAAAPESVDILIDEEVPLAHGGPAGGPQEDLGAGPVPEAETVEGPAFALDEAAGGLAGLAAPAEEEPFPGLAEGDGFPPGEVVSLAWTYGGHTAAHTARTDSTGAFAAAINREGQPAGRHKWDARLEAVASSCRPAVAYLWGEAGMKP